MSRKHEEYVININRLADKLEDEIQANDASLDPENISKEADEFVYQPPIEAVNHKVMYSNAQPTTRYSSANPTTRHSQATPTTRYASERKKAPEN